MSFQVTGLGLCEIFLTGLARRRGRQRTAPGGNQEGVPKIGVIPAKGVIIGGIRHLTTFGVAKLQSAPVAINSHYAAVLGTLFHNFPPPTLQNKLACRLLSKTK